MPGRLPSSSSIFKDLRYQSSASSNRPGPVRPCPADGTYLPCLAGYLVLPRYSRICGTSPLPRPVDLAPALSSQAGGRCVRCPVGCRTRPRRSRSRQVRPQLLASLDTIRPSLLSLAFDCATMPGWRFARTEPSWPPSSSLIDKDFRYRSSAPSSCPRSCATIPS